MSFTVFQDVPTDEAVKAKRVTSNIMATCSSSRSNNTPLSSSSSNELIPTDKENVNPLTGERAGTAAISKSKKRKTTVLSDKPSVSLALKKVKDAQPSKKRKASSKVEQGKGVVKKEEKAAGSARKVVRRVAHKVSKLPRLEEEFIDQAQETEHFTQASINSRYYDLMVQPLADVSQAYETVESAVDPLTSSVSKANFRKDASAEPDIRDFFLPSQILPSLPSIPVVASEPSEKRKFTTPECKQIYATFTFSSPSPSSERFKSL
ncbi:hypothetical protein Ac2012v2_006678 [Leucoagaricus gongylophorus]